MRKSIVTKVSLTTMGLLLITLVIQVVVQVFFLDDLYQFMKSNEMADAFNDFVDTYSSETLDMFTEDYYFDYNAPILVLDDQHKILNQAYAEQMNYLILDTIDGPYKVLLGDRVDEEGRIRTEYREYALGNTINVLGHKLVGQNMLVLDGRTNNPLFEGLTEIEGKVVKTHYLERDMGIFSGQSYKLLREAGIALNEDVFMEEEISFFEIETGLILTVQLAKSPQGHQVFSLYTMEDLSQTFTILNQYYGYIFIFQLLVLLVFSVFYSRWITKPLRHLIDEAKAIAKLDFSNKKIVKTGDELEVLSESLVSISNNMAHNIDQLKKDAQEKAENEQRMRELLANLSHEFKTPLGIISGFLEMMEASEANKSYYISTIEHEIDRLNDLTKETLLLCESENSQVYNMDEVVDLKRLFSMGRFEQQIITKDLKLEMDLASVNVRCDRRKMTLVIDNLMSNAIKYTDEGQKIKVSYEDRGSDLMVSIRNYGVTMSEEDLRKIWDKYYRREKSRNKDYGGNGLGLSIVKNILDHHKSEYGVCNEENAVRFFFSIKKSY